MNALVLAAVSINVSPSASGLPGTSSLISLVDGFQYWGILGALVGMIGAGLTWALSSHFSNYQGASRGRIAFFGSAAAAVVIGASTVLVQWLVGIGQGVH